MEPWPQFAEFRTAADEAYALLINNYPVEDQAIFRTEIGSDVATFTPRNIAILAGALREASLQGGNPGTPASTTSKSPRSSSLRVSTGCCWKRSPRPAPTQK